MHEQQSASVNVSNHHEVDVKSAALLTVTWVEQTGSLISSMDSCQQATVPTCDGDQSPKNKQSQ